MFQKKTVHASSEAELELAFKTADRIVVEGDSALREQAELWAKDGPPDALVEDADGPPNLVEGEQDPQRSRFYVWIWLLSGLLVFGLGVAGTLYLRRDAAERGAQASENSALSIVTLLVWPTVALLALCMMFLLARQALAYGANVRFEWKVSEKIGGTLELTKVRAPRRR